MVDLLSFVSGLQAHAGHVSLADAAPFVVAAELPHPEPCEPRRKSERGREADYPVKRKLRLCGQRLRASNMRIKKILFNS